MAKRKSDIKLTHLDSEGKAHMVDVTAKSATFRRATAESFIRLSKKTLVLLQKGNLPKGNALETARLAGIMAAKRTYNLIPLCHPLLLTHVDVDAEPGSGGVATVSCSGSTGVEMEALTAASVAALTLYDMVKAVEKGATIEKVRLLEKSGGKSGLYKRTKD